MRGYPFYPKVSGSNYDDGIHMCFVADEKTVKINERPISAT